jgi:hypothetical protein
MSVKWQQLYPHCFDVFTNFASQSTEPLKVDDILM